MKTRVTFWVWELSCPYTSVSPWYYLSFIWQVYIPLSCISSHVYKERERERERKQKQTDEQISTCMLWQWHSSMTQENVWFTFSVFKALTVIHMLSFIRFIQNLQQYHIPFWNVRLRSQGVWRVRKGGVGRGEKLKANETKVISFSACWLSWACCFASWPFFVIGASSWAPQGQARWGLVVDDQVAVTTTTRGTPNLASAVGLCLWCRCWHHSKIG